MNLPLAFRHTHERRRNPLSIIQCTRALPSIPQLRERRRKKTRAPPAEVDYSCIEISLPSPSLLYLLQGGAFFVLRSHAYGRDHCLRGGVIHGFSLSHALAATPALLLLCSDLE